MFDTSFMSFARRFTSEGIFDDVSEQTKPTGIPFVCYEGILICPFVMEYAMLAINLSLLQHSHLIFDTLDRKEQIFLRENQIHQSSLNPPDRATIITLNPPDRATSILLNPLDHASTILRLITQATVRSRQCC